MSYQFVSEYRVGRVLPAFPQEVVKAEPMLFSADRAFAAASGGPITRAFLAALPDQDAVIDTRVHMLMPNWFPCIPGWHHDDVPRDREDGQPEYESPSYRSSHIMALIGGDIAPTEFAVGAFDLPHVEDVVYRAWHPMVERAIREGSAHRSSVPSNRLIWFDDRALHQGVRASAGGWRWFGRASYGTHRKPANEIRTQVQVYLEYPMEGW